MSSIFNEICTDLESSQRRWLITGVGGFIGSNILETLLKLNQIVVGLDNFETGFENNLQEVQESVSPELWKNFTFINEDICNFEICTEICKGVDIVLHQAALGSVPRSIENPLRTNQVNITGFLNILTAAKDNGVKNFVYAASSSTYGDHPDLPKLEENIGKPLSPYAVTKYVNEVYSEVYKRTFNFDTIGLRYFNVFGPRQNPKGAYAAVIPRWINAVILNEKVEIFGDGQTSRDFSFVKNIVQANILAATTQRKEALNQVYNIAVGESTSLTSLLDMIVNNLKDLGVDYDGKPMYSDFRKGDVRHSMANVNKAKILLGYEPEYSIQQGLAESMPWYLDSINKSN